MTRFALLAFAVTLSCPSIGSAAAFDLRASAGRFEDCELIDLGPKGRIAGSVSLSEVEVHPKWASVVAFILSDDSKFQTSFRFALTSVTTSGKLEARYEFFSGTRRPVAEGLSEAAVAIPLPFALSWDETGVVEVGAGFAQPRKLSLDFKPTRAFVLVSGGRGKVQTEGNEKIDCSRHLSPSAK